LIDKPRRARRGQSFVGLLVVLLILTLLTAFGAPRVDLTRFRSDSLARQAASVFSVAKRTSRQQRHDVLVRVDSAGKRLCTVADINGNGVRDPGEKETWTDLDSSTELLDPPSQLPTSPMPAGGRRSLDVSRVTAPVVRGQVAFRRTGAHGMAGGACIGTDRRRAAVAVRRGALEPRSDVRRPPPLGGWVRCGGIARDTRRDESMIGLES
jgi:Tfp pilus assembly protein FimT